MAFVQALKKSIGSPANVWQKNRDRVASEYQGSQTIERYGDPADARLIDYATKTVQTDPGTGIFYRFRISSNKRFAP